MFSELFLAGVLGLEPRIKVLETFVIPFHYTPIFNLLPKDSRLRLLNQGL